MALISMSSFTAPKRRPSRYMARDAAYAVGGNAGYYIASRPRPYPLTSQQRKVKEVALKCNIKAGMPKKALMQEMKDCVGPAMRK
jgi:hypothetical protein